MKLLKAYLKALTYSLGIFGAFYILLSAYDENIFAIYFTYIAALSALAGPIGVLLEKK